MRCVRLLFQYSDWIVMIVTLYTIFIIVAVRGKAPSRRETSCTDRVKYVCFRTVQKFWSQLLMHAQRYHPYKIKVLKQRVVHRLEKNLLPNLFIVRKSPQRKCVLYEL